MSIWTRLPLLRHALPRRRKARRRPPRDAAEAWLAALSAGAAGLPAGRLIPAGTDAGGADVEEPPRCCGWFDSSHELHRGLQVVEHAAPETLAHELSLSAWLDLYLCRGPAAPIAVTALPGACQAAA